MASISFRFTVNGTDENPFDAYGLEQNPFPQHGEAERNRADLALQSLARPIKDEADIRSRLRGALSDEVIDRVARELYRPGECVEVHLTLTWQEGARR